MRWSRPNDQRPSLAEGGDDRNVFQGVDRSCAGHPSRHATDCRNERAGLPRQSHAAGVAAAAPPEAKVASRQEALLSGQLQDRLGPSTAEQLDWRSSSKRFGGLQEPEGGSHRREGELLENLCQAGKDASGGIGIELPTRVAPLGPDP